MRRERQFLPTAAAVAAQRPGDASDEEACRMVVLSLLERHPFLSTQEPLHSFVQDNPRARTSGQQGHVRKAGHSAFLGAGSKHRSSVSRQFGREDECGRSLAPCAAAEPV